MYIIYIAGCWIRMSESGCSICLESGDNTHDRGIVTTGCCKHEFHLDCIIQLYMTNKDYTCPLCRGKMDIITTPACPEDSEERAAVYILEDEEEELNSSSESEEDEASSSSEGEEEEDVPGPGSILITNDHIHIYCRKNSGRLYIKDKLSQKPITELEISHDLPVVNGIKSMVHWSRVISLSFQNIVIYDEHHIYIYNIRNAKLIKEYRFYTNGKIQNLSIGSHNGDCYIYIEIEGEDIYQRGKISYVKGQYNDTFKILECSSWISREY